MICTYSFYLQKKGYQLLRSQGVHDKRCETISLSLSLPAILCLYTDRHLNIPYYLPFRPEPGNMHIPCSSRAKGQPQIEKVTHPACFPSTSCKKKIQTRGGTSQGCLINHPTGVPTLYRPLEKVNLVTSAHRQHHHCKQSKEREGCNLRTGKAMNDRASGNQAN